jgi:hypothetical protein
MNKKYFYYLFLFTNYFPINIFLFLILSANSIIKTLDIHIAENKETTIQIASINQNHLIKLIPKIYKIIATKNQVRFESQIADQDFLNQILLASIKSLPFLSSSLILSKIRIFASIAIPIDNINHATEAKVRVTQNDFIIVKTITTYKNNEIEDIKPENL